MTTADRMAVLDKGVLQQVGAATELYDRPRNRFVAGFVGTANLLAGAIRAVDDRTLEFEAPGLGRLNLPRPAGAPASGSATLAFRPHQVAITADRVPQDPGRIWLAGQVESAEFLGEVTRYRVRVADLSLIADQPHYSGVPMLARGAAVQLGIPPAQLHYLAG